MADEFFSVVFLILESLMSVTLNSMHNKKLVVETLNCSSYLHYIFSF